MSDMMSTTIVWSMVNWGGVAVAAFATFGLGFLWFGVWCSKAWAEDTGIDMKKAQQRSMVLPMSLEVMQNIVQAVLVGVVLSVFSFASSLTIMTLYGVAASLGIAAGNLWQMKPLRLTAIVAGEFVLALLLRVTIIRLVVF